jgi:Trypsin-co-occurring domain 2
MRIVEGGRVSGREIRLAAMADPGNGRLWEGMDLADAVYALRSQLHEAAQRGEGEAIAFELGDVELEFHVELTSSLEAGGQARFVVLSAEASLSRASARAHTVRLTLKPRAGKGDAVVVDDGIERVPAR